jgi:hypothetical protein
VSRFSREMQGTERDLNDVRRDYGKMWGKSLGMSGKFPIISGICLYGMPSLKHRYWDMNPITV